VTPLGIEIMLHYYCRADDYPRQEFPAVGTELANLVGAGVLARGPHPKLRDHEPTRFHLTEGGEVYVEALKAVPLPVRKWVMPEAASC
jgi:hypothetical protein